MDLGEFVTCALKDVTHSTVHRPNFGEHAEADKGRTNRGQTFAPHDKTIWTRNEGTTVQTCGDGKAFVCAFRIISCLQSLTFPALHATFETYLLFGVCVNDSFPGASSEMVARHCPIFFCSSDVSWHWPRLPCSTVRSCLSERMMWQPLSFVT